MSVTRRELKNNNNNKSHIHILTCVLHLVDVVVMVEGGDKRIEGGASKILELLLAGQKKSHNNTVNNTN